MASQTLKEDAHAHRISEDSEHELQQQRLMGSDPGNTGLSSLGPVNSQDGHYGPGHTAFRPSLTAKGNIDPHVHQLSYGSQVHLMSDKEPTYLFERYLGRAILNSLGPLIVVIFYVYVVASYMLRPAVNGVIQSHVIPAKGMFYAWVIVSIFLADWAKSGIAGFEAAALMKPRLAPKNGLQLMWHADRSWGGLSGWYRALVASVTYLRDRTKRSSIPEWKGPGLLWTYLALSSSLFYVALPLSGLSMDIEPALRADGELATITGCNETNFALIANGAIQDQANNIWRVGNPTTPVDGTVFYAPAGTKNVSNLYFDDQIQKIYQDDLSNKTSQEGREIEFFSGPRVAQRAQGKAWGLKTSVSCLAVKPSLGLQLINATSASQWKAWYISSKLFDNSSLDAFETYGTLGLYPVSYFEGTTYGVDFQYILASNSSVYTPGFSPGTSDYSDNSTLPIHGSFEIMLWQDLVSGYTPDDAFRALSQNPIVESSSNARNATMLGYGVKCEVVSDVGFANLDGAEYTFSDFESQAANFSPLGVGTISNMPLSDFPGPAGIEMIVLGALSGLELGIMGLPTCIPQADNICSALYGANQATGVVPELLTLEGKAAALQLPVIEPARLTLAMYKIFGQSAAGMMQTGFGDWTGQLYGFHETVDIVPGRVPWQLVLALLSSWMLLTVIPQAWVFWEKRWSGKLDAFELFRFGAEFKHISERFESMEFVENEVLKEIPGMIGDMDPTEQKGFIGLSRYAARASKTYTNRRQHTS